MSTWKQIRNEIRDKPLTSAQWKSDSKHLLAIVDKAEEWEIDPLYFKEASISNLRTIIRYARSAIRHNDREKLEKLLQMAASLTTVKLRIQLGTPDRVGILVEPVKSGEKTKYQVFLTKEQLDQISRTNILQYQFIMKEKTNE